MSGSTTPMRVSFVFELADQQAALRAVRAYPGVRHTEGMRNVAAYFLGLAITATALLLIGPIFKPVDGGLFFWAGIYAILIFFWSFGVSFQIMSKRQARTRFLLNAKANQTVTNEISESGVTTESGTARGTCGWPDIRHYVATSEHLFLQTSPLHTYIFPRRAFASDTDFNAVIAFTKDRIPGKTLSTRPKRVKPS